MPSVAEFHTAEVVFQYCWCDCELASNDVRSNSHTWLAANKVKFRACSSLLRSATKADPSKAVQDALSAASRQSSQVRSGTSRRES